MVAVDLGTGGPKAAVVSAGGQVLAHAFEPVALQHTDDGGVEQDPREWWQASRRAIRRAVAASGVAAADVVGIGCTAQFACTVAVDPGGEPLGNAISWLDGRGAPFVRRQLGGPVTVLGYDVRKLARWVRLTGGAPTLSGRDPIGHIHFLRHARPDIYRAASTFLEPVDFLNLKLTGRVCASGDSMCLYWLTDNRDVHNIRYADSLVTMAGLERRTLPELVPTNSVIGGLQERAARELGLPSGTPVVTGTGDLHSVAVGSGAVADFAAHLYIGTSSWVSCHVPFKKTDALRNVASIPSALPGRYIVADEHETAGACLTFLRDSLLFADDGVFPGSPAGGPGISPPEDALERFNRVAATVPPGARGVIFTPWLNGERSPVDDHTLRGGFHNLSLSTTRADLVRAVFEGVALNSAWLLQAVERFVGRSLDALAFVGGGARSDLWAQMHADVTGRTVRQMQDPVLANARGAAILVLLALGRCKVDDVPLMVSVAAEYRPSPAAAGLYRARLKEFVQLYRRTKGIHKRLNGRGRVQVVGGAPSGAHSGEHGVGPPLEGAGQGLEGAGQGEA